MIWFMSIEHFGDREDRVQVKMQLTFQARVKLEILPILSLNPSQKSQPDLQLCFEQAKKSIGTLGHKELRSRCGFFRARNCIYRNRKFTYHLNVNV